MNELITSVIKGILPDARIYVKNPLGDGQHFYALVVSDTFEGMGQLQRQRKILVALKQHFDSGHIHALSIKTYTEKEYEEREEQLKKYIS